MSLFALIRKKLCCLSPKGIEYLALSQISYSPYYSIIVFIFKHKYKITMYVGSAKIYPKRRLKSWNIKYNFKCNQPYLSRGLNLSRVSNLSHSWNSKNPYFEIITRIKTWTRNKRVAILKYICLGLQECIWEMVR